MEYVDIYDYKGRRTGKTKPRYEPFAEGEFMKAVVVCIFNKEGKLLIQKRHENKKNWPGLWDVSVGGAVQAGEDSQESAMREIREEIGLDVDLQGVRPHIVTAFSFGFTETYLLERDICLEELTLQEEEVSDAAFASLQEVLSLIEEGKFVKYKISWIRMIFECYKEYGTFEYQ